MIPGNHDMGQKPTEKNIEFYFRHYENDKFNFIHKNIQFIGINSCYINSENENEDIQFHWLKKNLESNPQNLRRIVFTHHPFFIRDIDEKDNYSNIPLQKRKLYMDLFVDNNVKAIFSGHYHNNAESSYKSVDMITTSAVGKQLGQAKSGFRIVKVYSDSLSHEYIEISNLPKKIKL
ncbi:3',5'-cyclic adenosine monophosphate phosphodiesterase CpdA [bioreactor metagenome]|uniref:3',5'-cyclic adenosine monophosphate phosphodiesterase CpdA n=1 Tax=bioreactor metagenome TaxID=1076179 RepID=A0A645CJ91_9ZZZZ